MPAMGAQDACPFCSNTPLARWSSAQHARLQLSRTPTDTANSSYFHTSSKKIKMPEMERRIPLLPNIQDLASLFCPHLSIQVVFDGFLIFFCSFISTVPFVAVSGIIKSL
jgi:hypothetical protein